MNSAINPPLLVTGSARLDAFRTAGDALTGRTFFYRLHPIDLAESRVFLPSESTAQGIERLLTAGGFPEAFLNPDEAARLRNDRMEFVTREDLRDLSRLTSWRGPADLVELLRERVARPTNFDNLAQSLGVSPPTSKAWVELLEKLYIVFLLPPYSDSLARSIRKDRRIYFFDCAAARKPRRLQHFEIHAVPEGRSRAGLLLKSLRRSPWRALDHSSGAMCVPPMPRSNLSTKSSHSTD